MGLRSTAYQITGSSFRGAESAAIAVTGSKPVCSSARPRRKPSTGNFFNLRLFHLVLRILVQPRGIFAEQEPFALILESLAELEAINRTVLAKTHLNPATEIFLRTNNTQSHATA